MLSRIRERLSSIPARASIIGLLVFSAFANSLRVPFLLDDEDAILANSSIEQLTDFGTILSPRSGGIIAGRPLLNFTFAANFAVSKLEVRSYHAFNIALHVGATLTLFALIWRTLSLPKASASWRGKESSVGFVIAGVWAVHPVLTNCVTYISQRAETLMGLFYLLTLLLFVIAATTAAPRRWLLLSVVTCFCGIATKEVMATAPLIVLLFDRIFVANSFRQAVAQRWWYYLGLASSWAFLAYLMSASGLGSRGVGFQTATDPFTYAITELKVVIQYLGLALWPHPLVFDYGQEYLVHSFFSVGPFAVILALIVISIVHLFYRGYHATGFVCLAFFVLLAPTSSVVPVGGQPMAESRLYLSLAAVITISVCLSWRLLGTRIYAVMMFLAVALTVNTLNRNRDYHDAEGLWRDTLAKQPGNARAHNNLGMVLRRKPGRLDEAIAHYREALRLRPDYAGAHNNLANDLCEVPGHLSEALQHYEAAIRYDPNYASPHLNLGIELAKMPSRWKESIEHLEAALRLKPSLDTAHIQIAVAYFNNGHHEEAIDYLRRILAERPSVIRAKEMLDQMQSVLTSGSAK